MAYLIQQAGSPYWTAQWTSAAGKKVKRSTRVRIKPDFRKDGIRETAAQARARAQQIADAFEQAYAGTRTAQKLHATINELMPTGGVPTIREYLNNYLTRRSQVSPKTVNNDKRAIARLLEYLGSRANGTLDTLTTADVNAWMEYECGRVRTSTASLYRSCVHAPFRRAYEEQLIARDPFALSRMPKTVESNPIVRRAFALDDLHRLLQVLDSEWAMAVRLCVLLGGLRLGDVCNLRWEQFDLERKICRLVTRKRGIAMEIPLLPALIKHLENWAKVSAYLLPRLHARYNSRSRTSLSTEFTAMTRALGIGRMTGNAVDRRPDTNGMTDLTFHMLRSTCATLLHEAGVDEAIAMRILSHNSSSVHHIYVRPTEEVIRSGMEHLGSIDL